MNIKPTLSHGHFLICNHSYTSLFHQHLNILKAIKVRLSTDYRKCFTKRRDTNEFTIDCYYQLLSGFLITFNTIITISEKVSFAMP